ncbi:MAG: hypothetical protein NZ870_04310 [bacterium]|nr:hypothetical protein [bacterium]
MRVLIKTLAFFIAYTIDLFQIFIYFKILYFKIALRGIFKKIYEKLPDRSSVESFKSIKFFKKLGYIGVVALSAMPLYVGGIWIAFVLSSI